MSRVSVSEAGRNLSHWINRAAYGQEYVILESHGRPKAVLIGMETFEELIGVRPYLERRPMLLSELRASLRESFEKSGYRTEEDILELIHEVKKELVAEQDKTP